MSDRRPRKTDHDRSPPHHPRGCSQEPHEPGTPSVPSRGTRLLVIAPEPPLVITRETTRGGVRRIGRPLRGLVTAREALRLRPNDPNAFDSRGLVYLKMGDFNKAIADYDQSLLLGGEASSLYGRGIAKLRNGDAEAGNKDIAAATKSQPGIAEEFRGYGVQ